MNKAIEYATKKTDCDFDGISGRSPFHAGRGQGWVKQNHRLRRVALVSLMVVIVVCLIGPAAWAQGKGSAISVHHGVVVSADQVQLESAAGAGALLGGAVGYATAAGRSKSTKWRNAVIGTAIGGAATAKAEQGVTVIAYTVETKSGTIQVATDQTEVRVGDCVAVEQKGNTANIRRVSETVCSPAAEPVLKDKDIQAEMQEEADECLQAKQGLLSAETTEQIEMAKVKIGILCND
jgi:hypothetical protein